MSTHTSEVSVALIAAAGAFLVAWTAGGFSLLGLIISKEQEVSGFRQAWIDSLRADLAALIAHAHEIQSFGLMHQPFSPAEFWKATRDDYLALNQASTRIKLRLNPDEAESKSILHSMSKLESLLQQVGSLQSQEEIVKVVDAIERHAPALLKKEWKRVKRGEPIYLWAKGLAVLIFFGAGSVVCFLLWKIRGGVP